MNARMDTATALKASLALTDAERLPPRQFPFESPAEYRARIIATARINLIDEKLAEVHGKIAHRYQKYVNAVAERDAAFHACVGMSGPDEEAATAEQIAEITRDSLKAAFKEKWALQAERRVMMGRAR
jgi:hypothetical protein